MPSANMTPKQARFVQEYLIDGNGTGAAVRAGYGGPGVMVTACRLLTFWSARIIIAGIETMHMIRKGQMDCPAGQTMSAANQFYSLAA